LAVDIAAVKHLVGASCGFELGIDTELIDQKYGRTPNVSFVQCRRPALKRVSFGPEKAVLNTSLMPLLAPVRIRVYSP
jgi:hypothetical protein